MSNESIIGRNLLVEHDDAEIGDEPPSIDSLTHRPRRLRRNEAVRRLVRETSLDPSDLVLPVFYREGLTEPREISSMPGVFQHSKDSLRAVASDACEAGLGGIMLFGVTDQRDETGSGATNPNGALSVAVRTVKEEVADSIVVMADLCLDEFTSHGHCGVLGADGKVDNDRTLERYQHMAALLADCGSDFVGTSGMMDGQVGAVRTALDYTGFEDVGVIAYTAKYASALYGPFREAVESTFEDDRTSYQQDPANRVEAIRELQLDLDEGADIVIVKPAGLYLDIVSDVAANSNVPVAAYQVSGEYAMINAASAMGAVDREALAMESLTGMRRAGADILLSYFALEATTWLERRK